MQMNPSLAVYQGMKRAGINFASSVPCVNLDEGLIWVVSLDGSGNVLAS
jgi:sulfopyruvate decarboxylase TPP-binding subunit